MSYCSIIQLKLLSHLTLQAFLDFSLRVMKSALLRLGSQSLVEKTPVSQGSWVRKMCGKHGVFCGPPLLGSVLLEQVVVLGGLHLLLGLEGAFALAETGLLPHGGCWPSLLAQQLPQGCDPLPCLLSGCITGIQRLVPAVKVHEQFWYAKFRVLPILKPLNPKL